MSSGPIDRVRELSAAIDDLLAADLDGLVEGELHELVVGLQRQRHRLAAVTARTIVRWDRRTVWADNGSLSAAARLATDTSTSMRTARAEVRRARQLASMPATEEALAAGDLSPDHVDLLGKANKNWRDAVFADHEAALVDQCRTLRFEQARRVVDYWCLRADSVAADEKAERIRAKAHLDLGSTLDDTVVINGLLDPIGGSIVSDEIDRLEEEIRLAEDDDVVRTSSQRRALALIEMARRSAAARTTGRRARPLFTVLVGDETLSNLCELANGTVIAPGQLVQWMGEADLEAVLFDGPSTVISVSHRRTFTGALRRAVEVRDRNCQHISGCDVRYQRCDVDHIEPASASGPTSQFNGRLECAVHNRNAERHDHGEQPLPSRRIYRLDEIRCRLRWQLLREQRDDGDDDEDDHLGPRRTASTTRYDLTDAVDPANRVRRTSGQLPSALGCGPEVARQVDEERKHHDEPPEAVDRIPPVVHQDVRQRGERQEQEPDESDPETVERFVIPVREQLEQHDRRTREHRAEQDDQTTTHECSLTGAPTPTVLRRSG
jgi:hypothetical protein